jgi:hypothetical protein
MSETLSIHELLRTSQVRRTVVSDSSGCTPVRDGARVVVCIVDGTAVQAIVPASLIVNLERLLTLTGAGEIRLGREDERSDARSAEPIFVDVRLASSPVIVFTTDTAAETVAIHWADFARRVRPIVGDFAEPPRDRVGAYRLSYRE